MGYTPPPIPRIIATLDILKAAEEALSSHDVYVSTERAAISHGHQDIMECAYCRTPKASPYVACPNCGAYAIRPLASVQHKLSPRSRPTPLVTMEWR